MCIKFTEVFIMISPYPHLIDLNDYPVSWWKQVVDLGEQIKNHPEIYAGACHNKIMATLFYEPSTRTQMSFQTAMPVSYTHLTLPTILLV